MKRDRQTVNIRQAEMLALIRERQEVLVDELSRTFDISPMTVRRDLQVLEEQGKINRFHGGASAGARAASTDERDVVAQCQRQIAYRAAQLVRSGERLLINGSSTALALLNYLADKHVRVFTNNALVVGQHYPGGVEVQLSGGMLRGAQHILTGDPTMRSLMDVRAERAFLGCTGISPDGTILCGIPSELGINETMIEHADRYYILADHTKIGKAGTYASFHLEKKGCVITDELAPAEVLEQLRAIGMEVIQARAADFPDEA
ncbi:MAG: DeoR/GlpR transcriptional regulator [Clostridia bacterium]|nr:DeoR/GlpR transcriptional regulator [Clostridia bacterium]